MTETPQERAKRFMHEADLAGDKKYTKGDVKVLLNSIAHMPESAARVDPFDGSCRSPATVSQIRRGDVFIAKLVGGKVRPWVVLHVAGQTVSAVAMTTYEESSPATFASQCRFWPGSFLAGTVSSFIRDEACAEVTRPYTARAHLSRVEAEIVKTLFPSKSKARTKPHKLRAVA